MPITNRDLPPGTILVATYRKEQHRVLVLSTDEGQKGYELDGGTIYKSPSAAGSAVMKGVSCNGWRFWSVEGEQPPASETPAPKRERKAAKPEAKRTFKQVRKVPNQKGVEAGMARWHCSACMKGFVLPEGETPEACPEGHARECEDELAPAE